MKNSELEEISGKLADIIAEVSTILLHAMNRIRRQAKERGKRKARIQIKSKLGVRKGG